MLLGDKNTYVMYIAPRFVVVGSLKLSMATISAGSGSLHCFMSAYTTSSIAVYVGVCGV